MRELEKVEIGESGIVVRGIHMGRDLGHGRSRRSRRNRRRMAKALALNEERTISWLGDTTSLQYQVPYSTSITYLPR
jgi:hypothetical protein